MLISQGDELAQSVYKTLEELLGIDTSKFVDKKIQDLDFELDGIVFLVEIKGINTNVKNIIIICFMLNYFLVLYNKEYRRC